MKLAAAVLVLFAVLGIRPLEAGFRSPESLVRNVYAYYGQGSPDLSSGLPRDAETARRFFDPRLHTGWTGSTSFPYDYFVQGTSWQLGPISYAVTRRQFDKTYIAVAFDNRDRAVTLNFIVVQGPNGWVITDVETPYDSLRMFLAQYGN